MPGINFPALFGQTIGEAYAKLFNLVAQQEVERSGYAGLVSQLKDGTIDLSQVEINPNTGEVRVVPPRGAATLGDASLDEITAELAKRQTLFEAKQDAVEEALPDPEEIEEPKPKAKRGKKTPVGHHRPEDPDALDDPPENVNYAKPA